MQSVIIQSLVIVRQIAPVFGDMPFNEINDVNIGLPLAASTRSMNCICSSRKSKENASKMP
jgi:hypothetical protein